MKALLATLTLSLSLTTFAARGIDGGGGNAVVCRDQQKNITSARLLDLYEGEILHSLQYEPLNVSIDERLKEVVEGIYGPKIGQGMLFLFKSIQNSFKLLPSGVALKPINDSGHIFIPAVCKVEQVANFYNMANVYIVSDIYNKMSDLDKLGLILHEVIYWQEREGFVKKSKYTRRVVANLLSKGFIPEPIYDGVDKNRDYFCSTGEILYPNPDGKKLTTFWATRVGRDWRLTFDNLNGHKVFSKKSIDIGFGDRTFPIFQDHEPNFEEYIYTTSQMDSLIDPYDIVSIVISNNVMDIGGTDQYMMIQWKGFDPDDKHDYQQFKCAKVQDNSDDSAPGSL